MFGLGLKKLLLQIVEALGDVKRRLQRIETAILFQGAITMSALDDLTSQVQSNTDAEQSAITLIQGLAAQLAAAATDPQKIQALSARLKASAETIAAAIVANTPAAPPAKPA